MDFQFWLNIICFFVSVNTLINYISVFGMKESILTTLPKSLRFHITFTIFPFAILTAICSFLCSVFYIISKTEKTTEYQTMVFTLTFTSQMLRISYFLIILELIIATIYLEKYRKYSSGLTVFYVLSFLSYFTTLLYLIPALSWIVSPELRQLYDSLLYFVVALHISTMFGCRILYLKNKQMYRHLAYRVSLDRRCQILENIKVTKTLWRPILSFSIIGSIGLIIRAISILIDKKVPFGIIHLFYNLSFTIAFFEKYAKRRKIRPLLYHANILGPLGKFLPTYNSVDHYFADLKKQWS